jgi:hypothetical protein
MGSESARGSVVAWGSNTFGQCNVPALPPGRSYVAELTWRKQ